jgi:hypothetical protein
VKDGETQKFCFARHRDVGALKKFGWVIENDLSDCHHGHYAVLMRWIGEGEPPCISELNESPSHPCKSNGTPSIRPAKPG